MKYLAFIGFIITVATSNLSSSQIIFETGSYERDLSNDALLFDELKEGYDVYFFTPLTGNLKGKVQSCSIRGSIPDSVIQTSNQYKERKTHYDSLDESQRTSYILPIKNPGLELFQTTYYFDSLEKMVGIHLGSVLAWSENEIMPSAESGSFQLIYGDDDQIAQFYLSGNLKNRTSNKAFVCGVYQKKEAFPAVEQVVFFDYMIIDTSNFNYLKIASTPNFSIYEPPYSNQEWIIESELIEIGGEKQTSFGLMNVKTEENIECAKRFYSDKGLLLKSLRYDELPCENPNGNDEVYYDYDKNGLPKRISVLSYNGLPEIYNIEWQNPDEHGNFQTMQVQSTSGELVRELTWSYTYW